MKTFWILSTLIALLLGFWLSDRVAAQVGKWADEMETFE